MIRFLYFFSAIAVFLFFPLTMSFAQVSLSTLNLSDDQIIQLQQEGKISHTGKSIRDIKLVPQAELYATLQQQLTTVPVKSTIETLYFLPNLKNGSQLTFYQAFFNISALNGLQFYSRSEKKQKELIHEAYFIDNVKDKKHIEHSVPTTLLPNWSGVILQNDETFGIQAYEISLTAIENEILVTLQNLEKLTQGIITMAKPKEMLTVFYIIQTNEGLILYQLTTTAQSIPGFVRDKAAESLFHRQDAYTQWITSIYPK